MKTYKHRDRIPATLIGAPNRVGTRGYGFAAPADGGDAIYIIPDAMEASGLTASDNGCRVIITMGQPSANARPFAMRVERDDREIGGEEPDVVEAAILARLTKLERLMACVLIKVQDASRGEIDDV